VNRCAVMRPGWLEETFSKGKVVAADAEGILGDDASKSVQLDPLQGGVTVLEHAGRKPRLLAVEDPNGWRPGPYFGIVFTHGKNVYRPSCRSPARHAHLAADNACRFSAPGTLREPVRLPPVGACR
jgi:hypothetical protein